MEATDINEAAEGLLIRPAQEPETETDEATQDDATEVEEVEEESAETSEDDADEVESEDEDEGAEESEADEQPQVFSVKVDGETKEVTLDELTRSYSGQAYIQKGMQENATTRKELEAQAADLQAAQQRFVETVQKLQASGLKQPPQAPDPKLLDTDPIAYMQADARYKAEQAEFDAQQKEISEVQKRRDAEMERQRQGYLKAQMQELQTRVPEFADPKASEALKAKLLATGNEVYGFSAEELGAVMDARTIQVLVDAVRWREAQSGKAEAKKKPTPPKSIKPTGRRTQPADVTRKKLVAQAKKSGKLEDFASLLLQPKTG